MGVTYITLLEDEGRIFANFNAISSFSANPKVRILTQAAFNSVSEFNATIRLREPVQIGSTNFASSSSFIATPDVIDHNKIEVTFFFSSQFIAPLNNFYGTYRFRGNSTFNAGLKTRVSFGNILRFLVDALPAQGTQTYQQYTCRFILNGVEYPIKKFTVKYPRNSIGMSVDLVLARISDVNTFLTNPSDSYKFEIGIVNGVTTTWHTIVESGKLQGKGYSIGFSQNRPTDSVNVSIVSQIDEKLSFSPNNPIIMYDVNRVEIDSVEIQDKYGLDGETFPIQLMAFNPLTLYDVFNVITSIGGFSSYQTNIPNFQIKRIDIPLTSSLISAVNALIAPFKPIITLINGILWFLDTTTVFPEGFPSPGEVTAYEYRVINKSSNHTAIDGFLVTYIENEFDGESYTEEISTEEFQSGNFGDDDYQKTEIETTVRKYFRTAQPSIITQEVIRRQKTSVYTGAATLISRNTEDFTYDAYGRLVSSFKSYEMLLPDVMDNGNEAMLTIREEQESITYGPHPYDHNRQIQLRRVVQCSGLRAVDSENTYFDEPFEQDYLRAHEAGNLLTSMSSYFAALDTTTEVTRPTNNGQVRVYVQKIDHVRNIVSKTISAARTGDIALSGVKSITREFVVLSPGASTKRRRIESFNLGEIPTSIGIPLVRRILEKANSKNSTIDFEWIGFDPYKVRGMIQQCFDREEGSLGYYLMEDVTIEGDNMGSKNQIVVTRFSGDEV